jgi:hypothetical protein
MEHRKTTEKSYVIDRKAAFLPITSNLIDLTFLYSSTEVVADLIAEK